MNIKLRFAFVLLFIWLNHAAMAQFAGPNAITYNPGNKTYYITNEYGKNVVSLDANNNKATFITGLTAPNNILYANLPIGAGFIVLDSNEIKGYDDAGTYYASFSTSGAVKLQDVVFDTAAKAMYITDVLRGVIYKTTFGAAPFYLPSTVVWSKPHRRPSAMVLQKSKNRILYVEDTLGGNLMAMNLSNGNTSLVKSLGIDNLVGLAEDGQGNLYLSSQGAKAIYQLNKYYAGSPKKLYTEPKPADLYVNVEKDQWVYTCIICGTVFTPQLHIFGPGFEIAGCKKDSFTAYRNFLMKNYGTFDQGNQFIMELSNAVGSFANPIKMATVSDTLVPDSIRSAIPNLPAGTAYKYRWRSTKPAIIGAVESFAISPQPNIQVSVSDTVQACAGSTVVLGSGNPKTGLQYQWSPSNAVDSAQNPSVKHITSAQKRIYLTATNTEGCIAYDSALILPVAKPSIGILKDTVFVCKGSTNNLGNTAVGGLKYTWKPASNLNDPSLAEPIFNGTSNTNYKVIFEAEGGCKDSANQFVKVNDLPNFSVLEDSIFLCPNKQFTNTISHSLNNFKAYWVNAQNDTTPGTSKLFNGNNGNTKVTLTDNNTGCQNSKNVVEKTYPIIPLKLSNNANILSANETVNNKKWYKNDTLVAVDSMNFSVKKTGNYKLCGTDSNGCDICSPALLVTINSNSLQQFQNPCTLYPNPAKNTLYFHCNQTVTIGNWYITDASGKRMLEGNGNSISIEKLSEGIYFIYSAQMTPIKFIKSEL